MPTAVISLAVSFIGILALIGLKRLEIRRGRPFLAHAREVLDRKVWQLMHVVRGNVPRTVGHLLSDVGHYLTVQVSALVLASIRFIERRLTRFVNMVKGRREIKREAGSRSAYLRDVTNHRDEVRRVNGYHDRT